jgi:hypothetical protein
MAMKSILPKSENGRILFLLSGFGMVSFALLMGLCLGLTELFFRKAAPRTLNEVGTPCLWLIGLDALCIGFLILARGLKRHHHRKGL